MSTEVVAVLADFNVKIKKIFILNFIIKVGTNLESIHFPTNLKVLNLNF